MESSKFVSGLVAPCGINCSVCKRYLAYSRGVPKQKGKVSHCSGCRSRDKNCYIKRPCKVLFHQKIQFYFDCEQMPCKKLEHLDKRYRKRYVMSAVENLKDIQTNGIENFLKTQEAKYKCPNCGDVFSVHDRKCYSCKQTMKV